MKRIKTLKLNYEFKNVFNRGKYLRAHQVIGYVLNNKSGYNRLGLAISTKLCKATRRNRIKRVIRAAYLDLTREYDLKQGYDIVFIWNKNVNIDNISYFEVRNDIKYIFRKFELIIEDDDENNF
jgi:ribonuclease P protein component